jgi:hypothetical protein
MERKMCTETETENQALSDNIKKKKKEQNLNESTE